MGKAPGGPVSWTVEGDLDIFSLEDQAAAVRTLLDPDRGLVIDLSRMGDLDPSGLQLLLSLRKSLEAGAREFRIIGATESLRERVLGLGVRTLFAEAVP